MNLSFRPYVSVVRRATATNHTTNIAVFWTSEMSIYLFGRICTRAIMQHRVPNRHVLGPGLGLESAKLLIGNAVQYGHDLGLNRPLPSRCITH